MKTKTIFSYFGILLFCVSTTKVAGEQVVTSLWHSGFENGWPGGEWHFWAPSGPNPDSSDPAKWDIVGEENGVKPLEGTMMYKGWVTATDSKNHRPYPVMYTEEQYPQHKNYIVNRFYVWVDVDLDNRTSPRQWLHFATWGSNTEWRVWTMSVVGQNEDLDLGHLDWRTKLSNKGDNFPMRKLSPQGHQD